MCDRPEGYATSGGLLVRTQDGVAVQHEISEVKLPVFKFHFTLTAAVCWPRSLLFLVFCSLIYKMEIGTKPAGVLVRTK